MRRGALARVAGFVACLALLVAARATGGEGWTSTTPVPTPRSEMPAAVLDGVVFVPGGLAADRVLDVVEAYDPARDAWRRVAPLPVPLHHTAVAAVAGRIVVAGGYTDLAFAEPTAGAWAYDPADGAWSALPDLPAPRAAHALVALGDTLWVVGGTGPRAAEVWSLEGLEGAAWRADHAPLPTPREHLAAVALDDRIHVVGGRDASGNLGTVEIYDPARDAWEAGPPLPTPRSGLAAAGLDGRIHAVGGEALRGGRTFAAHEVLEASTGRWTVAAPLPAARHGLAAAVVGDVLYAIAGATGAGSRTFETLTGRVDAFGVGGEAEEGRVRRRSPPHEKGPSDDGPLSSMRRRAPQRGGRSAPPPRIAFTIASRMIAPTMATRML